MTSYVKEFGGSAIMDVFEGETEEIEDSPDGTGLVEEEPGELPVSGVSPYNPTMKLPSWSDVKDKGIYVRERDQEHGTCVFESYDIMTIEALILQGLDPVTNGEDPFLDVNHSYFSKVYQPRIDSGTVPSQAYKRYKEEGLPIRTTYQDQDNENMSFASVLAKEDEDAYDYRITAPFNKIASGYGADSFFRAYEAELKKGNSPLFRISKRNHRNVSWFKETTPFIKSPVKDLTGGGHSMAGGSQFGIFEYRGEPTVYIYESTGVPYHLARLSVLQMVMTSWELYEVDDVEFVTKTIVTPSENDPLATATIRFGQRGTNVTELQKFLIKEGVTIPAGATGFFGGQTRSALNTWQDRQFGNLYDGSVWGSVSRLQYAILQNQ